MAIIKKTISVLSPIYGITDPKLLPGHKLIEGVQLALEGGIRTIQFRDKQASFSVKLDLARKLTKLCNAFHAQLIINDDIEIAKLSGAHGVHVGQTDSSVARARATLGQNAIIGVTCHSNLNLAHQAQNNGANYVAFGRFFNSNTKPQAKTASLNVLQDAKVELSLPIVAIGGITSDNMQEIVLSGAESIAICHELFSSTNIKQKAKVLMSQFSSFTKMP